MSSRRIDHFLGGFLGKYVGHSVEHDDGVTDHYVNTGSIIPGEKYVGSSKAEKPSGGGGGGGGFGGLEGMGIFLLIPLLCLGILLFLLSFVIGPAVWLVVRLVKGAPVAVAKMAAWEKVVLVFLCLLARDWTAYSLRIILNLIASVHAGNALTRDEWESLIGLSFMTITWISALGLFLFDRARVQDGNPSDSMAVPQKMKLVWWRAIPLGCFALLILFTCGAGVYQAMSAPRPSSIFNANEGHIDGVSAVLPLQTQTIIITGHGLGQRYAYSGDSDFLQISDLTRNWDGGWTRDPGTDKVGLNVTSWTDSKIVIEGFTGQYGDQWSLGEGDKIRIRVWNPQTGQGPTVYTSVVAGAATNIVAGQNEPPSNGSETESSGLQENSPQYLVGQWNFSSGRDKFKMVMSITSHTPDGKFTGYLSDENGTIIGDLKGDEIEFTRELTRFGGREQRYTGKLVGTRPNLKMVMGTWSGAFEENGDGTDWHAEMIPR